MPCAYRIGGGLKPCRTRLGQFIRDHRLRLGLSQRRVGELAHFKKRVCSDLEEGSGNRRYLRPDEQDRLAQVLQCDIDELSTLSSRPILPAQTAIGYLIRSCRLALRFSQSQLSEKVGCSGATIDQLERGKTKHLTAKVAIGLQVALGIRWAMLEPFLQRRHLGRNQSPSTSQLGNVIRARRLVLGLSLHEVADRAGCTHQALSLIELGRLLLNSKWNMLSRLARALDMNEAELRELCVPRKMKRLRTTTALQFLTARRLDLGLRQEDLAHFAGISKNTVTLVETGKLKLSQLVKSKLEKALGCQLPN